MGGFTGQPVNFGTTPAAPTGTVNVAFQADAPTAPPTSTVRNVSAYVPPMTASVGGGVPTPPNDADKFLDGTGHWTRPNGGGSSGNDISLYFSPASISPPSLGSWTWARQVNGTLGTNNNGAAIIKTFSTGTTAEFIGVSIANEDFDIIACFGMNPSLISGQTTLFGIALWDSGSGKVITFELNMIQGTVPQLAVSHLSSFTTFVTSVYGLNNYFGTSIPIWLRINLSFAKYTFYVSVDGQSWDQVFQEGATAYMPVPADHAGITVGNKASTPANLVIPHFAINSFVGS